MTRIVRVFLSVFSLQFFVISGATFSFAQVDPTKALVGTWEGQVQISGSNMGRTVTINSVKARAKVNGSRGADTP
jgi:hypothetical protein